MCDAIISEAEKGNAEIYVSALALAEVCKHPHDDISSAEGADKLKAFFENDYIVVVPLDRRVGELARDIMREGHPGLKPLDATHLATALVVNADELHTFDEKLLNLTDKLSRRDGARLKICKPSMGGPPLPLLEPPQQENTTGQPPEEEPIETHLEDTSSEQEKPLPGAQQNKTTEDLIDFNGEREEIDEKKDDNATK